MTLKEFCWRQTFGTIIYSDIEWRRKTTYQEQLGDVTNAIPTVKNWFTRIALKMARFYELEGTMHSKSQRD